MNTYYIAQAEASVYEDDYNQGEGRHFTEDTINLDGSRFHSVRSVLEAVHKLYSDSPFDPLDWDSRFYTMGEEDERGYF